MKFKESLVCVGLILLTVVSSAQSKHNVLSARNRIETSPKLLAQKLTASCKTEKEKVTAIFQWITENISYNTGIFGRSQRKTSFIYPFDEEEDTGPLSPLNERVAEGVLRRRVAVCDGYARLFSTLCNYAGIKSEIITGYARTGYGRSDKFISNHSWNAVQIDSTWHLLDATWASGYITYGSNNFVPAYNNQYFLSPPEDFIRDHYPEDLKWTLLKNIPMFQEYRSKPFRYGAFVKFKIGSFYPSTGIIEAAIGDTIKIELQTSGPLKNIMATTVAQTDSLSLLIQSGNVASVPGTEEKKATYLYTVTPETGAWLNVFYNDEAILRYKVVVKDRKENSLVQRSK